MKSVRVAAENSVISFLKSEIYLTVVLIDRIPEEKLLFFDVKTV